MYVLATTMVVKSTLPQMRVTHVGLRVALMVADLLYWLGDTMPWTTGHALLNVDVFLK